MIYLDHAATTPCLPEVREAMQPYCTEIFGNPSSVHGAGQDARHAIDQARDTVAKLLDCRADEVIFTGGGTEADNLALIGAWRRRPEGRNHLITAATEHHAITHSAEFLQTLGAEVTLLPVDGCGLVDPDALRQAMRPETYLVSIMAANNEIGTLSPIPELAAVAHEAGALFHTDAVQWIGALPASMRAWDVDMASLTAHKFYGPKGTGALYLRKGTALAPILFGGGHEFGRRAGTENVAGIVGLAQALEIGCNLMPTEPDRQRALRQRLLRGLTAELPDTLLHGHPHQRLPNNLNVSFEGVESEMLLLSLDLEGVAASSGSACTAGAIEPSHVLKAIGVPHLRSLGALRLSLGRGISEADVDQAVEIVAKVVRRLRA